ncbi:MAG: hypothetical protein A2Y25_06295 [Candidatus Melainabacteria bacterium GWF2_37_15]|nr:MAG: hypothetical protein A2Y25_06295 [Candidatus Melainabacteria bacterium GWF2_37_15]
MKTKSKKLYKGDTIGIISPSGAVKEIELFNNAVKYFESKGFKVKTAPHALDKNDYLAGNDTDRLNDLVIFFNDPEIKAIFCSRGGYGAFRILDKIPTLPPKIFVGYSDITALLYNFNFVTFHGPLAVSDFGKENINTYTEDIFWKILENNVEIPYSFPNPYEYHCIKPGTTEGILIGGNLSIICGLLGTPYSLNFDNKILLIEDVCEPLYKIDRMLAQLRLAGVFNKLAGVLFAEFTDVNALELITEYSKDLNIPIGYGFPAGHSEQKATLPLGVKYLFDSENFKLALTEDYLTIS